MAAKIASSAAVWDNGGKRPAKPGDFLILVHGRTGGLFDGILQALKRENIPVTAVVFNNGQWGAEKKNHVDFYNRRYLGVGLDNQPHWANVAVAMGAEGLRIDELSDVGPALREACEAQKRGKTTIIEVMVTKELGDPFRRDALALPTRFLQKYKHTEIKR